MAECRSSTAYWKIWTTNDLAKASHIWAECPRKHILALSRKQGKKNKNTLFGEGQETEPNYFKAMRQTREIREKFVVTVKGGHGFSQSEVMREVIKFLKGKSFDEIWCLIDVEGPAKRDTLEEAYKLAELNKIKICLSNPSFEVWFLSHFEKRARPYKDGSTAESALNKRWREKFNRDYEKDNVRHFENLDILLKTAVENAKWVLENHHKNGECKNCNSSTEVYRLILRLLPGIEKELQPTE